jgi:hypothetical protein
MAAILGVAAMTCAVTPVGTAFTYQGQLKQGGNLVNATADLDFRLWDAAVGGSFFGAVQHATNVTIANGLFTVDLDFGANSGGPNARWLEIQVRSPAGGGAFTTLTPRQRLQPTPLALYALNAAGLSLPFQATNQLDTYPFQVTANADDASAILGNAPNGTGIEGNGNKGVAGFGSTGVAGNGNFIGVYGSGPTAIYGESTELGVHGILLQSKGGSGVKGEVNGSIGITNGVYGLNPTPSGRGVFGYANATTSANSGVLGQSDSTSGVGVKGLATAATGTSYGGRFESASSTSGVGVYGLANNGVGVFGESSSVSGFGVVGQALATSGTNYGVYAVTNSTNGYAGYFLGRAYFRDNVGIGVTVPIFQLHLSTNSAAKPTSNTWTISSDRRLKKNINPIEQALDDLLALRGVTYQWIDPASQGDMAGTYTGMIAQDVEKVFPEWVSEDPDGYRHLTVIGFEGIVVEALRELRAEKDAQIAAQQVVIDELLRRVESLEQKN